MSVTVRFEPSGRSVEVARGTTLLEAARSARLPVASACGADGICGRCGMRILDGDSRISEERDAEVRVKLANRLDAGLRLACRVTLDGDVTATASYW